MAKAKTGRVTITIDVGELLTIQGLGQKVRKAKAKPRRKSPFDKKLYMREFMRKYRKRVKANAVKNP
jgi:hypothetical protein